MVGNSVETNGKAYGAAANAGEVRKQRLVLLGVVVVVAGLLGFGYYLQFVEYLDPCPLCLTQRLFYYLGGIFALLGLIKAASIAWQRVIGSVIIVSGLGGIVTAGRQIWLQHLPPDKVPECGPGLEYWLKNNPFVETLQLLFKGDGNCAEIDWSFLGLSIAGWSLLWFLVMLITGIWLVTCRLRYQRSGVH